MAVKTEDELQQDIIQIIKPGFPAQPIDVARLLQDIVESVYAEIDG